MELKKRQKHEERLPEEGWEGDEQYSEPSGYQHEIVKCCCSNSMDVGPFRNCYTIWKLEMNQTADA